MAGFRTFATGEVLTAANVNDFLMKQSVMVFEDADARTAALGAEVIEGMLTYNKDTDQLEVFDGTNFVIAAPEPPAPPAPPAGIGSNAVQAVKFDVSTGFTGSFSNIPGLIASITPSATNSRILVFGDVNFNPRAQEGGGSIRITRNDTPIGVGNASGSRDRSTSSYYDRGPSSGVASNSSLPFFFLDSPSTTSVITYRIQAVGTTTIGINTTNRDANSARFARTISTLNLIEVSG